MLPTPSVHYTHLTTFPGSSGFLTKCDGPRQVHHLCILSSPSGFYLRLPGSETEKSLFMKCQEGSMGMVLHAVGLCSSGALADRDHSPCPSLILPPSGTSPQSLPSIQGAGNQPIIHPTPYPHLLNSKQPKCHRNQQPNCCTCPNTTTARLLQRRAQALLLRRILG